MIVDAHIHLFERESSRYPRLTTNVFPHQRSYTAQEHLNAMSAGGVDAAIAISLAGEETYLREVLSANPRRFVGIGVLDKHLIEDGDDADLDDRFRAGIRGMRLMSVAKAGTGQSGSRQSGEPGGRQPGEPGSRRPGSGQSSGLHRVLDLLERRGMPLWVHVPLAELPIIADVATRHAELAIVINHLGMCSGHAPTEPGRVPRIQVTNAAQSRAALADVAALPNVYACLSGAYAYSTGAFPYHDLHDRMAWLIRTFGPDRVLWGSDAPWSLESSPYPAEVQLGRDSVSGLDAGDRAKVLGLNAARLLGLNQ